MNHVKKLSVFIGQLIFLAKLETHIARTRLEFASQAKRVKHDIFFPHVLARQNSHEKFTAHKRNLLGKRARVAVSSARCSRVRPALDLNLKLKPG